ncbi:MAG: excinuclease ABC subunit UvrC [Oscillospiraceae bacterium]|nr:excinuclease ABC subunit UvrC [Oscillospiraceae bacterium]
MSIQEKVSNLPTSPGVYIMKNDMGEIIYVGKAKNLKNRVSSYFQDSASHTPKTTIMVSKIVDFEYIVTGTELEALILECNLIKSHMPHYNIMLKDGKSPYPYIKITGEEFPKILLARKIEKDGARYFGPYLNGRIINETIDLVKKIFKVRDCNKMLPRDIGKGRPCLNYQINKCSAPCAKLISAEEYKANFADIIRLLNGNYGDVLKKLKAEMSELSGKKEFERATAKRDKILAIEKISEKQKITSTNLDNKDVIAFAGLKNNICITLLYIRGGKMLGRENFFLKDAAPVGNDAHIVPSSKNNIQNVGARFGAPVGDAVSGVPAATLIADFIKQYYSLNTQIPRKIVTQIAPEDAHLLEEWLTTLAAHKIEIITPQKGTNKDLVNMAKQNALESLSQKFPSLGGVDAAGGRGGFKTEKLLHEIKELLSLEKTPHLIESYDISHISGASAVGVCVTFKNGKPYKSAYRKFNIGSPIDYCQLSTDDYAAIREILARRFSHAFPNGTALVGDAVSGVPSSKNNIHLNPESRIPNPNHWPLPDLILIDGGKGHVSSAKEIAKQWNIDIPIFGLVKNDKHKTRAITTENDEISLPPTSRSFKFFTQIQDEVHRFALKSHTTKHKKTTFESQLMQIKGIGKKKQAELLQTFGSIDKIKSAKLEELVKIKGITMELAKRLKKM